MPRFLSYDLVQARLALSSSGMLGLAILASAGDKELRRARSVEKEESPLSAIAGQWRAKGAKLASAGLAGAAARNNWSKVPEQLPNQFKHPSCRG
jgi:hypothetical protein